MIMSNLWERQQNKRAKEKKERAKRNGSSVSSRKGETPWVLGFEPEGAERGTVVSVHRNKLDVMADGRILECRMSTSISSEARSDIAVGDRVWIGGNERNAVLGRKERKTSIVRMRSDRTRRESSDLQVLAANVDVGIIVVSLKDPDPNPRLIDRYLVLLQDGGVQPVICCTKSDLVSSVPPSLEVYKGIGIPLLKTSAIKSSGMDELKELISNKTAAFLGQSGVGKSSLIKSIVPTLDIATKAVSHKTGEGRHTTTRSNLYEWAHQSFIIDTPGTRSLGVERVPRNRIRFLFPEFSEPSLKCTYHDCLHVDEPGCGVRERSERMAGSFRQRYESYLRMMV